MNKERRECEVNNSVLGITSHNRIRCLDKYMIPSSLILISYHHEKSLCKSVVACYFAVILVITCDRNVIRPTRVGFNVHRTKF